VDLVCELRPVADVEQRLQGADERGAMRSIACRKRTDAVLDELGERSKADARAWFRRYELAQSTQRELVYQRCGATSETGSLAFPGSPPPPPNRSRGSSHRAARIADNVDSVARELDERCH
jgi:hypothetical protein